jgi:sulfate adenylyltransferase
MISPYGNEDKLNDLFVHDEEERMRLLKASHSMTKIKLDEFSFYELLLLSNGSYSPLKTFMSLSEYISVCEKERLLSDHVWTIPVLLFTDDLRIECGQTVALIHFWTDDVVAILHIDDCFTFDKDHYAKHILNLKCENHETFVKEHPFYQYLETRHNRLCVSGKLDVVFDVESQHFDPVWVGSPEQVRRKLRSMGNDRVVAFQTRNPMHRAHEELTKKAAESWSASLLIHPTIGPTKNDDIDWMTRSKCHLAMYEKYFDHENTLLSFIRLPMRMAGPKEAVFHAIVRRNYGASHFIVGRDHAGPGKLSNGNNFYGDFDAQQKCLSYQNELGIVIVASDALVWDASKNDYVSREKAIDGMEISGTRVRNDFIRQGKSLPAWFTRPEVATLLSTASLDSEKGFCLWLTGLPCSGKSTLSLALQACLQYSQPRRKITIIDGDEMRKTLCKGLGFSKEDRLTNVERIAYVAKIVVDHGGIAIVSSISPYKESRLCAKKTICNGCKNWDKRFVLIYLSTPSHACVSRDVKGLYEKKTKLLSGIDDPYEEPDDEERNVCIDTSVTHLRECCRIIMDYVFKNVLAMGQERNLLAPTLL